MQNVQNERRSPHITKLRDDSRDPFYNIIDFRFGSESPNTKAERRVCHVFRCTCKQYSQADHSPHRLENGLPKARRTYEGSSEADVQALPDERATSYITINTLKEMGKADKLTFRAINRLSPSTYEKLRLTQPG